VTGTPVRECRRGGIIESDWDVGVRTSRRRGLAMCLVCDLDGTAGELADAVGVMVRCWGCVAASWRSLFKRTGCLLITKGSMAGCQEEHGGSEVGGYVVGRLVPALREKAAEMRN
jgi:hypothetical protein